VTRRRVREHRAREERVETRARRTPEEARAHILAAAEKLLAAKGPDAVGLKDVAAAAGVSHALVSHYFGTYDALVEATLESQSNALRYDLIRRMMTADDEGPEAWIEQLFEAIGNPLYGRLIAWAILSGRLEHEDFFPRREQGMRDVANALEGRYRGELGTLPFSRDDLEFALLLVMAASFGYSLGRPVLWASLAREETKERDVWFRKRLAKLVEDALIPMKKKPKR